MSLCTYRLVEMTKVFKDSRGPIKFISDFEQWQGIFSTTRTRIRPRICWFQSKHPQPSASLRCYIRACERNKYVQQFPWNGSWHPHSVDSSIKTDPLPSFRALWGQRGGHMINEVLGESHFPSQKFDVYSLLNRFFLAGANLNNRRGMGGNLRLSKMHRNS